MGIFSKAPIYSQKSMGYKKVKNSPVMKKIMADKDIARVLDEPREREEFYRALKTKEAGGVTKRELQEVFGNFQRGKGKFISRKEGQGIAKKFFSAVSDRYKYASSWDCGSGAKENSARPSASQGQSQGNYKTPQKNMIFPTAGISTLNRSAGVIAKAQNKTQTDGSPKSASVSGNLSTKSKASAPTSSGPKEQSLGAKASSAGSKPSAKDVGSDKLSSDSESSGDFSWFGKYAKSDIGSQLVLKGDSNLKKNVLLNASRVLEAVRGDENEDENLPKGSFSRALKSTIKK